MIAYCGIDCAKCPLYRLPRLGERLHLAGLFQRLLKGRMKSLGLKPPEGYLICDGCTAIDARMHKPCLNCVVRCCAMEMGVANCARCARFGCERLQGVWQATVFRDARARLERLHREQQAGR
jgi:hypothetical protein